MISICFDKLLEDKREGLSPAVSSPKEQIVKCAWELCRGMKYPATGSAVIHVKGKHML